MGPAFFSETSVRNYHYQLRNNPEERSYHLLRGGSLRSHNAMLVRTPTGTDRLQNLDIYRKITLRLMLRKFVACAQT